MTNALDDFKYLNRWFSIERTYRPKYERIVEALTLATESEQLRKRLAELETAIEQANKKIQWYERTEATND